jgi:hypothetical protein
LSNKGQVFTPDFAASVTLFSAFLIGFALIWTTSMNTFVKDDDDLKQQTSYAFNLLKSSGEPDQWSSDNVQVPGLFDSGKLSKESLSAFNEINLSKQRQLLRLQDFRLSVDYLNGTNITRIYTGPEEDDLVKNISDTYVKREYVVIEENGKRAEMRLYAWE